MKKLTTVVLALTLLAAACGDDDTADTPMDPAEIGTCEELADATIDVTQQVIDVIGDLDAEAMAGMMSGEMPEAIASLEETGTALSTRAQELECTDFGSLLAERADQLEAGDDNGIGKLIISSVESGEEDVFGRLSR